MKLVAVIYYIIIFNAVMSLLSTFIGNGLWFGEDLSSVISLPINDGLTTAFSNFTASVGALTSGDITQMVTSFINLFLLLWALAQSVVCFIPDLLVFFGCPFVLGEVLKGLMLLMLFWSIFQLITNRSLLYQE